MPKIRPQNTAQGVCYRLGSVVGLLGSRIVSVGAL